MSDPPSTTLKKGVNPCCGLLPLRTATKTIAIFQVVFSIVAVVAFIVAAVPNILGHRRGPPSVPSGNATPSHPIDIGDLYSRSFPPPPPPPTNHNDLTDVNKTPESDDDSSFPMWINLLIVVSIVFLSMMLLMASINLFKGARDKVQGKCKMWMVINIFLFFVMGVVFGFLCFHGVATLVLGLILVAQVFHGYFIFVVNAFTQQI